jgi:ElaA protein
MVKWLSKSFEECTKKEIHDLFALRAEVFVVEQHCVYQDLDGKDPKAVHIFGLTESKKLIAYSRILEPGIIYSNAAAIGRIVVAPSYRNKNIGHDLVAFSLKKTENLFPSTPIKISAQSHLTHFYETHGFKKEGKEYLEDGIPHIAMLLRD